MLEKLYEIDFAILAFIRENLSCGFLDAVMKLFTYAGNWGIIWIALTLGLLISKKYRRLGVSMAIGLLICLAMGNLLLKPLIARDRPFIADPGIILAISPPSGYSFPSGHSFSSFVSASILAKYSRKAAAFAIPTAILIAFSRLYFCVHFPTDVLCGAALGIAAGLTVCRLRRDRTSVTQLSSVSEDK